MVEIRQFDVGDLRSVWELHQLGLRQYGVDLGDGPWDDDLRDVTAVYSENRGQFLVAVDLDRIIGMGGLRQVNEEVAEIKRMRVHPEFQRQGMGTAILHRLEECARELGYRSIILDTTRVQTPAQEFYRKNGFVEIDAVAGAARDVLCFRKEL